MSFKQIIHQVYRAFQDYPGLLPLTVCGAAAVLFIGMIFLPHYFRRMRRRWRGRKRGAQA